jgi:Domain of unknown function (DUF4440)
MNLSLGTPDQPEIWRILHNINQAWVSSPPEQIANLVHPKVVYVAPNFQKRMQGREACVASYQDFCNRAKIHSFSKSQPVIDVRGDAVVATYQLEIRYEMNQQGFHDTGRDLFVLAREDGEWKAVWRTILGVGKCAVHHLAPDWFGTRQRSGSARPRTPERLHRSGCCSMAVVV